MSCDRIYIIKKRKNKYKKELGDINLTKSIHTKCMPTQTSDTEK